MIISVKTPKIKVIEQGSQCSKDNHCCRFTTGFLAEDDVSIIAQHLGITERELKEKYLQEEMVFNKTVLRPMIIKEGKPYGRCIFLDEEAGCTIHEVKPLQCKVATCQQHGQDTLQWFYVNYLLDKNDPESIRQYAQFIRFHQPIPGGSLEELVPDEEKLRRILSYEEFKKQEDSNDRK